MCALALAVAPLLGPSLARAQAQAIPASAPSTSPADNLLTLELRSITSLPRAADDARGQPVRVVGISGITWQRDNLYLAVLDHGNALVTLEIDVAPDALLRFSRLTSALPLPGDHDREGIALNRLTGQSVFISDEASRTPPPADPPAIREHRLSDGQMLRSLPIPPIFAHRRINRGFEALAAADDMSEIWTANEEALTLDGPASTRQAGCVVRLQRLVRRGDAYVPDAQFAYVVNPIHASTDDRLPGGDHRMSCSGLCDLVVLPGAPGRLLALERSFASRGLLSSFQTRIYEIDTRAATDLRSLPPADASASERAKAPAPGLVGRSYAAVAKRLLYRGDLANLEGLCLGPRLEGGGRLVVGVADNNGLLANTFATFELRGLPDERP